MKALTTLFVVGMVLMPAVLADDADDVRGTLNSHFAARNAGDTNAWAQSYVAGNTRFGPGGGLLERSDSLEEQRKNRQAARDAGLRLNLQDRHIEVSIYGNSTAVATSYRVGSVTFPDGSTAQPNNRITTVLIKQGGQWKIAHVHISPVRLPQ